MDGFVGIDAVFQFDEFVDGGGCHADSRWLSGTVDNTSPVLRVEVAQHGGLDATELRDGAHRHILVDHDGVGVFWQCGYHRTDIMVAIIGHDIVGSDEGRYVATCLRGQVGIDFPIIHASATSSDGFVDILWSTVVGGDDECPVAKDTV